MKKRGRKLDVSRSFPLVITDQMLYRLFRRSVLPCYVTLTGGSRKPMLTEAAGRLAATVEGRYDLTIHVPHLALGVDSESRTGIVDDGRRPGRIEGGLGDFVSGSRLSEIEVIS
jgi:hypothetical protein